MKLTKKKSDVLYFDSETFTRSMGELKTILADVQTLADAWRSAGCLPELNKELFLQWKDEPGLIYHLYDIETAKRLESLWPGASKQSKTKLFELELSDPGRVQRLLEGIRTPHLQGQDIFLDLSWIDFKEGKPFISPDVENTIREKCTLERTPENEKLFDDLEQFCNNYNGLLQYLEHKTGNKVVLSDFRGIQIDQGKVSPDTKNLIRELYYKNDNTFRYGMVPGNRPGGNEKSAPVKIPANWVG